MPFLIAGGPEGKGERVREMGGQIALALRWPWQWGRRVRSPWTFARMKKLHYSQKLWRTTQDSASQPYPCTRQWSFKTDREVFPRCGEPHQPLSLASP